MTQAEYIESLLVQLLSDFDPNLDLDPASTLYTEVVQPIADALGIDPLSSNAEDFILARLREEYPNMSLQSGDAVLDLLVRPVQVLLEGYRRELEIIKRGQNLSDIGLLTLEQAEDLSSNFFITRKEGSLASGVVRIFFSNPTYVSLGPNTEFGTTSGLLYRPAATFHITPQRMINQRSGSFYYIDVPIEAVTSGDQYNIEAGAISIVSGVTGAVRVTNQFALSGGINGENAQQLLTRAGLSLTERSLNTRRGIRAQILELFKGVRTLEVVGYGDPEMKRDLLTGTSGGKLLASGICMVVGSFVFMISMFEDHGSLGLIYAKAGNKVDLNFSKIFYDIPEKVQSFTIQEMIFSSEDSLKNTPTVYIFKLDKTPDVQTPTVSTATNLIPGALPGVFGSIYGETEIEISTGPDLINNLTTNEVNVGGKIDVLVQPSQVATVNGSINATRSEIADFETLALATSGSLPASLVDISKANIVASNYVLTTSGASPLAEGTSIRGRASGATAVVVSKSGTGNELTLTTFNGIDFTPGEIIESILSTNVTSVIAEVSRDDLASLGVKDRSVLHVFEGQDVGLYKVIFVDGAFAYLDSNLTASNANISSRFVSTSKVNLFNPVTRKYPFPEGEATGLQCTIGLNVVTVQNDLLTLGVNIGDTLELLDGTNKGVYTITTFGTQGGFTPILSEPMQATDSNVQYIVYSDRTGLESPLIRILPDGVSVGTNNVPYAIPVGALSLEGFSGSKTTYYGTNGFVLPDPGATWKPASNTFASTFTNSELSYMESIGGGVSKCFTYECDDYGEDLVCTLTVASDVNNAIELYLQGATTASAETYLSTLRSYFSELVDKFGLGNSFKSFIDLFGPITFGAPPNTSVVLKHYEILLPRELFDSYNNVFVAIPEFNWKNEFAKETTFQGALDKLNTGTMVGSPPGLLYAKEGDCFTISDGPNAGSYRISKVHPVKLYLGSSILTSNNNISGIDDSKAYDIVFVTIEGEFPHKPANGLSTFFDDGITTPTLPAIPPINIQSMVTVADGVHQPGDPISPFEVVQKTFTWLFQFLHDIGFDVDNSIDIDPGPTLQKIVQLLFIKYFNGHQSCEQDIRFMFQDPCEIVLTGSRTSRLLEWYSEVQTPATITTENLTSVGPLSELINFTDMEILLKSSTSASVISLTGSFEHGALLNAYNSSSEDFLDVFVHQLDPNQDHIEITLNTTGPQLTFTAKKGGAGSSMHILVTPNVDIFPNMDEAFATGGSANGAVAKELSIPPLNPTIALSTAEEQTLEFAAKLTSEDYMPIYPQEDEGFPSLKKDILFSGAYNGSLVVTASSNELDVPSWFKSGVRLGDEVYLYEQKFILDPTGIVQSNMYRKTDRVTLLMTTKSSVSVSLIGTPDYTFRSPESGDASDYVEVGDICSIESGPSKGMYEIVEVSDYELKLDSKMKSNLSSVIVKNGDGAVISVGAKTITVTSGTFTSDDIGNFISVFGSSFSDTDGSYEITQVDSSGAIATVDTPTNFQFDVTDLLWAVTSSNLETPASSEVEGRTDTLCGYPFRIYSGTPKKMPIVEISKHLLRNDETITCYYGSTAPKIGKNQPYRIVRPNMKLVTAETMSSQSFLGLFYADCTSTAITPDLVSNIPSFKSLMPKVNSLSTRGYHLVTTDENLAYSSSEECFILADASWTARGQTSDSILEFQDLALTIDLGIEASAVQGYLDSRDNRILCSDPLVKAFCPSYVYFSIVSESSANSSIAASQIKDYIDNLQPEDPLIVSELEKFLHKNGISNYQHPVFIVVLTHDLDRKIIMCLDQDRISDATLKTKVTNRTTFFVTGDPRTSDRGDGREVVVVKGGLV